VPEIQETSPVADTATHHQSNRAFYDRISRAYDLIADANERPAREAGLKALDPKPGERVLEVGFGTGNEVLDLASRVAPGGRVCGIDISPGMLAVAQDKIAGQTTAVPVELQVGDARQLPYPADSFDAVYSSFTLELFPEEDLPTVLAEVKRVLRRGGRVGVVSMAVVKPSQHPSMLERTYIWMHRHFPHIVDCRPIDPAALLTTAGFRIVKQIDLSIWSMPVAAVVAEKP
jgi:ubiquinone/menaquinone biosynthesis C-methylase UbiE